MQLSNQEIQLVSVKPLAHTPQLFLGTVYVSHATCTAHLKKKKKETYEELPTAFFTNKDSLTVEHTHTHEMLSEVGEKKVKYHH